MYWPSGRNSPWRWDSHPKVYIQLLTIEVLDMGVHEEKLGQSGDWILSSNITTLFIIDDSSCRRNNATLAISSTHVIDRYLTRRVFYK